MKTTIIQLIGLGLLLMGQPRPLSAQQKQGCRDMLRLHDGSQYRGQLEDIRAGGDTLVFRLWSGLVLEVPQSKVRRIVQRCQGDESLAVGRRPYDFKERGWYHHTRGGLLIGQVYSGQNSTGFFLQHSSGWMINRWLGAGLGAGGDFFDPWSSDVATYPVFAEIRGYLIPHRISPYYSLGGGYAFAGQRMGERWGYLDDWHGGWMAQTELGYRIGNHFTVHLGLRLQRKYRDWASVWGPTSGEGTDRILHKRLVFGLGLLL